MLPSLDFMIKVATTLMQFLHLVRLRRNTKQRIRTAWNIPNIPNVMPVLAVIVEFLRLSKRRFQNIKRKKKPHNIIKLMQHYRCRMVKGDMYQVLCENWDHFFWLTGEIPRSFQEILTAVRRYYNRRPGGRRCILNLTNQLLLTLIWLRRYPSLQHLAMHFGIPVTCVHRIIHRIIPILHAAIVPTYIKWHNMNYWRRLQGTFPTWPNVVAIIDCTPFRISKPAGNLQRLFYRHDRKCFFMNWLVIIDVEGYIVLSRPGFVGTSNDSTCLDQVQVPILPRGLQIMADKGFVNKSPYLVPISGRGMPVRGVMKSDFSSCRNTIERCFGTLKSSYCSAGTRRWRHSRYFSPLICNVSCALFNKRKHMFNRMCQDLYM